jgi:YidC/Oxa1 family membrane protein insertase
LLTPLTVKSTKSMIAMQRLQPEIKRLQQKYKGAENRQKLNEEMMALYKKEGINPAGGCLPLFLQMPFLIILYDTIRGLTTTVTKHVNGVTKVVSQPRYIPKPSAHASSVSLIDKLYTNLVHAGGHMFAFGVDFSQKPFSHGLSIGQRIPLFAMVLIAVGLQYFQMKQMNSRNPQATANKQMQMIQKFTPILFAYIYFLIPAAVVVYMIVSTLIRIATQYAMFQLGIVQPPGAERQISGAKSRFGLPNPLAALTGGSSAENASGNGHGPEGGDGAPAGAPPAAIPARSRPKPPGASGGTTRGSTSPPSRPVAKAPPPAKPSHPRAKDKRPRKAR